MDTKTAESLAGGRKELCALLGVSSPAVSMWKGRVPQNRVWQLKALRPGWFSEQVALATESSAPALESKGVSA